MHKPFKPFKIDKTKYNNIYFASDFHRQHDRNFIYEPRGFKSCQEHTSFIDKCCTSLTSKDLLIFLGDVALNSSYIDTFNFIKSIKAQKFWIWGNHYSWELPIYEKALNIITNTLQSDLFDGALDYDIYPLTTNLYNFDTTIGLKLQQDDENLITFFGQSASFHIGHTIYFCRHMAPLIWDRQKYDNFVCLCGHSHGNLECAKPSVLKEGKILDIGVDNAILTNGTPFFTIEEIDKILSKKKIKIYDHHRE